MDEIEEYFKKAERKLESSKILYDVGEYSNSLSLYYAMLLASKALLIKIGITTNKHHE